MQEISKQEVDVEGTFVLNGVPAGEDFSVPMRKLSVFRMPKHDRRRGRKPLFERRTVGERIAFSVIWLLFVVYSVTLIYPFIWLFLSSVKPFTEYTVGMANGETFALPKTWRWENYSEVFSMIETGDGVTFFGMIFNSIWQSVLPIIVSTLLGTWFAYIVSRFRFPGRGFLYGVIIFSMTVPVVGNSGGYFKLVSDLGLYNNPLFSVFTAIPFGGMAFMVYYGFFKNIPHSYAEAVYMDGGGEFTVFFRIMLPQAIPIIIALAVQSFVGTWNDYLTPLLYLPSYSSLASGMYLVKNTLIRNGKDPLYFAGLIVTLIPVLAVFIAFSDKMMESMSIGGLKG